MLVQFLVHCQTLVWLIAGDAPTDCEVRRRSRDIGEGETVQGDARPVMQAPRLPRSPTDRIVSTHSLKTPNPREVLAIWRAFLADEIDEILRGGAK